MDNTWDTRDYPVLDAIVEALDSVPFTISLSKIAAAANVAEGQVKAAVSALMNEEPDLLTCMEPADGINLDDPERFDKMLSCLAATGYARRVVGAWPEKLAPPVDPQPDEVELGTGDEADDKSAGPLVRRVRSGRVV